MLKIRRIILPNYIRFANLRFLFMGMFIISRKYILIILFLGVSLTGISQQKDLNYYLQEGLQNSPLLNDLTNQLHNASLDSLLIQAQQKPFIEGKSQLAYFPYNDHLGYDEVITNGGNYQVVASVSQNIFNKKIINNKYGAINNQRQSVSINKKLTTAELKKTITDLYLESYSVYSELLFNRSFLDLMKSENMIVNQFVKSGIYSQTDYISLLVETEGQEVIINQLKNEYKKDIWMLNEACGITDTTYVELILPVIEPGDENRPSDYLFLKPYLIDSLQIINEKNALDLKYRPSVSWFADAGFLTSNPWNFYRHFGASAGVSLTIPIYDGKQRNLEEKKLSLRESTRSYYNMSTRRRYDQAYLRLKGELEGMKETKRNLDKQFNLTDQLVKALKIQLETGQIKMTDYLNAIKTYRNVNHNLNMADIKILGIINEMNYILSE